MKLDSEGYEAELLLIYHINHPHISSLTIRQIVELDVPLLELYMDLQIVGDRNLRKLAFSYVVHNMLLVLVKKDRGHPIDLKARPKVFGEVNVANDMPSVELLKQDDDKTLYSSFEDEMATYGSEAENDSSPVDNDICARVAYEEDENSLVSWRE
ncbi:hypothetical protein HPP92_028517 [Vanilla planifolia]|uniref:Protein SDA1 n=1 Tax=Vanilla planifolia TaxID=51239 RepID=A0A835PAN2_VANPL|nr:hypothetical protein HPP92_028517 [Vanilla planifolia]